jgi:MtaA/CmuA family methyltransferase
MSSTNISSRELVTAAIQGANLPRFPVGPLAVHFCARLAGVTLRQYTTDARVLAESVIRYYETFRPDAVWLSADTWVNAQAMGASVAFPGDDQPLGGTGEPLVKSAGDIDHIPPAEPGSQGRWPLMLEALERIRRGVGPDVCLVGCFDQYPFSLACALLGIERAMVLLMQDRPMLEALMHRCLEYTVAYAKALSQAGADLLSGGDSPAGLVHPGLYREAVQPLESRVIGELRRATAKPISLHICGNTRHILPDMVRCGADVLELDHQVGLTQAQESGLQAGGTFTFWGNLDTRLLADATPPQIQRATRGLVKTARATGNTRFVLSSGCSLAVETSPENLRAFFQAAREPSVTRPEKGRNA